MTTQIAMTSQTGKICNIKFRWAMTVRVASNFRPTYFTISIVLDLGIRLGYKFGGGG